MKKSCCLICLVFLVSCAPEVQRQVFISNQQQMGEVRNACNKSTAQENNPHAAAVDCSFSAYEDLLKKAGFQDMDLLNVLKKDYLSIAKRQDSKRITGEQADALYHQATKKFDQFIAMRDDARSQDHQQTMMAIAGAATAMGDATSQYSANRYQPTYASTPTYPSAAPTGNIPDYSGMMNSYNQPSPAPMPVGGGARGYDGITGQVDRTYIPAGPDPNPPPNVMGQ
jgi:hypothetical protein